MSYLFDIYDDFADKKFFYALFVIEFVWVCVMNVFVYLTLPLYIYVLNTISFPYMWECVTEREKYICMWLFDSMYVCVCACTCVCAFYLCVCACVCVCGYVYVCECVC